MSDKDYFDMDSAPKYEAARFLVGGREVIGQYEPYWCGSDCPCDVAGENEEPLDCEPECWCVYPIKDGRVIKTGLDDEPQGWRPL